jgi:hypothetical protein
MNVGTGDQPIDATPPALFRLLWASGRLALFCCFILSGIVCDTYESLAEFLAGCGEVRPSSIFSWMSLVPAVASIIFARNLYYKGLCFSVWVFYCFMCAYYAVDDLLRGICLRMSIDGGAPYDMLIFTLYFASAIVAITSVFGMFVLARNLYEGWRRRPIGKTTQELDQSAS